MRMLCIVPSGHEADYLHKGLKELAYGVDVVHDLDDGMFYAAETPYDAIVVALDEMTQQAIERLVAISPRAAHIVIASEDSSALRTSMLRAGADACLTRPWSFMELQARLQVIERRARLQSTSAAGVRAAAHSSAAPTSETRGSNTLATPPCDVLKDATVLSRDALQSGDFRLDAASRSLIVARTSVPLSRREYLVLQRLMREVNAAISRDQLLDYAWTADEHADAATINTLISRLRAKTSAVGIVLPLETVVGHGYRFVG